jgi:hypothetical protein
MAYCIILVAKNPKKFDSFKEDYTKDGKPLDLE